MSLIKDIAFAAPIGAIYNIFIHKVASVSLSNFTPEEKHQKIIILVFIIGIISIYISQAFIINRAMRYGIDFGGALLIFYSLITNWSDMNDDTKLVLMGIILSGLVWYCYSDDTPVKIKKKSKKSKRTKKAP